MLTLGVALASMIGFIVAYNTYGRWLARKIFDVDSTAVTPSEQLNDGVDFVPTRRSVIFGHHFTSIAGTGPIVGPAIAVFWGWLPALLWVVFGSIFVGAVHDFGALIVSLRNRGQTVGEVAGRLITPRARVLFLLVLFFALTIVLAIFGLVIAKIFDIYPQSVLSVWIAMPLAIAIGVALRRGVGNLTVMSLGALALLYGAVWLGVYHMPISLDVGNPVMAWTVILMVYCFAASVLPVWLLLQPRDYINSQQLFVALALLIVGLAVAGFSGQADLIGSAPAISQSVPADAPPIFPFLFITIACGACSGFHCLVSSGTTSKQIANETDAQPVAYGGMLLEGMLAVLVILACTAGLGIGRFDLTTSAAPALMNEAGAAVVGQEAWLMSYGGESWAGFGLGAKLGAFIEGGANFVAALGVDLPLAVGLIAVLVACFAATTLDTATRLQRYVIQELADSLHIAPAKNKYVATTIAVGLGLGVAAIPATPTAAMGTGGLILWPLFGATNQLLAGLAFLVTAFYLWRRQKPVWFLVLPMILLILLPAWALSVQIFHPETGWYFKQQYLLFGIGITTLALQVWMVIEALLIWPNVKGVLEEGLPPLAGHTASTIAEPAV